MRTGCRSRRAAILIAALLPAAVGCGRKTPSAESAGPPTPKLDAVKVRRGDIARRATLPAELAPWREVTLYAKIAGYLKEWKKWPDGRSLDIGDEITRVEGDAGVLAILSVPELEAEAGQLAAEIARAEADRKKAAADKAALEAAADEPEKERLSGLALVKKAESAVRAAEADAERSRSDLALADTTHARYKSLLAEKAVTDLEYEQALARRQGALAALRAAEARTAALRDESAYAAARLAEFEAKVRSAKARIAASDAQIGSVESQKAVVEAKLRQVRTLLEYRYIRAPFPGVITRRYVDLGALIQSAASSSIQAMPVVSLADASVIRVVIDIPESEVAFVGPDTAGTLALPEMPGRTFSVRFSRSGHTLKPNTRTLRVEMDLPNPDRLLKPGLFGQVTLVVEMHRGTTVVPSAAVGGKGADRFVFLAVDGKAVRRSVQVGFVEDGLTEIRAGSENAVSDGQVVLLAGAVPLQEGRPVEIRLVDY